MNDLDWVIRAMVYVCVQIIFAESCGVVLGNRNCWLKFWVSWLRIEAQCAMDCVKTEIFENESQGKVMPSSKLLFTRYK